MISDENKIIATSMAAGLGGLLGVGALDALVGFPGQIAALLAFSILAVFGAMLPQLYLSRVDDTVSRTRRFGVVTLVMLALAVVFSGIVSGPALTILWVGVLLSLGLMFVAEIRDGYRTSILVGDKDV